MSRKNGTVLKTLKHFIWK